MFDNLLIAGLAASLYKCLEFAQATDGASNVSVWGLTVGGPLWESRPVVIGVVNDR